MMNVGGSVWALDWCPRMHKEADCSIKCEVLCFRHILTIYISSFYCFVAALGII